MESIVTIIVAILGSGAFFTFIQFIIQRNDKEKEKHDEIMEKLADVSDQLTDITKRLGEVETHNALQNEALLLLARNVLQSECRDIMYRLTNDKVVSSEKIDDIMRGYYIYHIKMKGNSYTTTVCRKAYNLYYRMNLTNEEFIDVVEKHYSEGE